MPIRTVGALLLLSVFLAACGLSAPSDELASGFDDGAFERVRLTPDGWPRAFAVAAGHAVPRARFFETHGAALGLGPDDAMLEEHGEGDGPRRSTRYAHVYKGVPVVGSGWILHEMNGTVVEGNGHAVRGLHVDVVPRIVETVARGIALGGLGATANDGDGAARLVIAPQLALVPTTARGDARGYRLAWIYDVARGADAPLRTVAVAADDGALLLSSDVVEHAVNVDLKGETYYDGVQNFVASSDGASGAPPYTLATVAPQQGLPAFEVACRRRGASLPLLGEPSSPFTSSPSSVAGGLVDFSAPGTECRDPSDSSIAIETAWAAEYISSDWLQTYGWSRPSSDPSRQLRFVIDGSVVCNYEPHVIGNDAILLGFEHGRPASSLDVIAHEMGHDMLHALAGHPWLHGRFSTIFREWASLNEGVADILAFAVDDRYRLSHGLSPVWTFGLAQTEGNEFPAGWRDAADPKRLGQPDAYEGRFWGDGSEEHTNATVLDHWFYLLAAGGAGSVDESPDPSRAYAVVPLDTQSTFASITLAARVAQAAFKSSTMGSDFHDYAAATLSDAVTAPLGLTHAQVQSIKEAWFAVGIGDMSDPPPFFPSDGETGVEPWTVDLQWRSDSASALSWTVEIAKTQDELTSESGPSFQTASVRADVSGFALAGKLFGKWVDFVLDPSATYVWRVRTDPTPLVSTDGPPWSAIHTFTTASKGAPRFEPGKDAVAPWSARFAWGQVAGATGYALDVWPSDRDPADGVRQYSVTGGGATEIVLPLPSRQSYRWRVWTYGPRASRDGPRSSDVSDTGLVSTGDVEEATATSISSQAWDYAVRIEPPAGTDRTVVEFSGQTKDVRSSGAHGASGTLTLRSSSLDMDDGTFDFDLTPVGPAPFVSRTPGVTQTSGPTDPVDPETGPTTAQQLPVDWSGTTAAFAWPLSELQCVHDTPVNFLILQPRDARGTMRYVLTLTPDSGGPAQTYTVSHAASDPNDVFIMASDACSDRSGYRATVQAFEGGAGDEPGAPTSGHYAMGVNPPLHLSPGVTVDSRATPPSVDPAQPVTLSWTDYYAPYGYEIHVEKGTAQNGATPVVSATLGAATTTYNASLDAGVTYTWWVDARKADAGKTVTSGKYTFTTGGLSAPTLQSPVGVPVDADRPVPFVWTGEETAVGGYSISIEWRGSHQAIVGGRRVKEPRFELPAGMLMKGFEYDWSVTAIGGGGDTATSAPAVFSTLSPPAPPPAPAGCGDVRDVTFEGQHCEPITLPTPGRPFTVSFQIASGAAEGAYVEYQLDVQAGPEYRYDGSNGIGYFAAQVDNIGGWLGYCDENVDPDCSHPLSAPRGWFEPVNEWNDDARYASPIVASTSQITLRACIPYYPGDAGDWKIRIDCR